MGASLWRCAQLPLFFWIAKYAQFVWNQNVGAMESIVLNLAQLGAPKAGEQCGLHCIACSDPDWIMFAADVEQEFTCDMPAIPIPGFVCWSCECNKSVAAWTYPVGPFWLRSTAGYACATVDESYFPGERTMNFVTPAGFS